jgi:chitinase
MANSTATYQPKVPVSTIKSEFPNAKVMIAVGGWGDDIGFYQVSQTDATIKQFAVDVATMLTNTGADGVGKLALKERSGASLTVSRHRLGVSRWQRR